MNKVARRVLNKVVIGMILSSYLSNSYAMDFPEPPDAQIESVSPNTTALGMTMNIRRFESGQSTEDIIEFYRRHWRDEAVVTDFEPWKMVGMRVGKNYLNVQVQAGLSGSWGYLSISDLPERLDKNDIQLPGDNIFPQMAGSNVINDQLHEDPMKLGRTVLLVNSFSVASNGQFYLDYYLGQGWQLQNDTAGSSRKARVMTFSLGKKFTTIVINRIEDKTSVAVSVETARVFNG